jgi:hypothetical protein
MVATSALKSKSSMIATMRFDKVFAEIDELKGNYTKRYNRLIQVDSSHIYHKEHFEAETK